MMRQRGCSRPASGLRAAAAAVAEGSVPELAAVHAAGEQRALRADALGRMPQKQAPGWVERLLAQLQA